MNRCIVCLPLKYDQNRQGYHNFPKRDTTIKTPLEDTFYLLYVGYKVHLEPAL